MPCCRLSRIISAFFGVLAAVSLCTQPAAAQPRGNETLHLRSAQFVAHALKLKALDETGWDWPGSDEIWVERYDFAGPEDASYFTDMDTGETKSFPVTERCIAPQPNCTSGTSSLRFGLVVWEIDDWEVVGLLGSSFCPGTYVGPNDTPEQIFDYVNDDNEPILRPDCDETGSDLIGKAKVILDQAQLVALLPAVGQSVDQKVIPTGGSGKYEITYRITRLPDVVRDIVIHEPPIVIDPVISLQAVVSTSGVKHVALTWSGATTANVDVYRNGAVIATTANDGAYDDVVPKATYQYRVCNAGSTSACSAIVTIIVN
jgi:hypothetical protein